MLDKDGNVKENLKVRNNNENNNIMWKFKVSKRNDESCRKMALEGNCILTPVYPVIENCERTDEQLSKIKDAHFKRIELSDAILVINKDNYIGNSTNLEIEYAKKLEKEIIYYTDLIKEN